MQTTHDIYNNIVSQLEAALTNTTSWLPKTFSRVLAKALAGVFVTLYKFIGFGALQGFIRYASAKPVTINGVTFTPLHEWGETVGEGLPTPAVQAVLRLSVTVESQGGTLPTGAQLIHAPTGVLYLTVAPVSLLGASVIVDVRASADNSGAVGNVDTGGVLSFVNSLANVAKNATVIERVIDGADAEAEDVYRARVFDRFRKRPQGGALADYEIWGESPSGILNVYPYRSTCPGQVDVYVEATPESSGNAGGIPTVAQLNAVLNAINFDENGLATRRPVGALVNALPISRMIFNVDVIGLAGVNISDTQAAIISAINEYFSAREPYVVGLAFPPRLDQITQAALGGVVQDVVSSAGGTFGGVILHAGPSPVVFYTLAEGQKCGAPVIAFIGA